MKQREIFLRSEGDARFERNFGGVAGPVPPDHEPLLQELLAIHRTGMLGSRVLEIGCGDGARLDRLAQLGLQCYGIEPSAAAVAMARSRGLEAVVGTADTLPFEDAFFDVVIFGFCLYLCDRDDLFKISAEADRVLHAPGWLLIHDFYSPVSEVREYHHHEGVVSHKMDYRTCFSWHPAYSEVSHRVAHHELAHFADDRQQWVGTSVLRKAPP